MRFACAALALTLLAGCAGHRPPDKNEIMARVVAGSVQIFTEREGGIRRAGSGVILGATEAEDATLIVTANHLLAPPVEQTITVRTAFAREPVEAEVVALNAEDDLALLAIPGAPPAAVTLTRQAHLGDPIWVVAFPWGRSRTVVQGVVSQVAERQVNAPAPPLAGPVRLIDASVSYGMSGGGVFAAATGELLGIVRGYRTVQVALPGAGAEPIRLPVAGETTVVPSTRIACFLANATGGRKYTAPGVGPGPC